MKPVCSPEPAQKVFHTQGGEASARAGVALKSRTSLSMRAKDAATPASGPIPGQQDKKH